ncbi:MAG TPA: O-methyltransferase [Desertimonas sp.]|nr:O-methyltransferase [Desertimonas sp.]
MAARQGDWIDNDIVAYIAERTSPQPDAALDALRTETSTLGDVAIMQVSLEEGALLTILTRLVAASFAVEVGTFTGYSSICIARGLQPGGRLLCCDVSETFTAIARRAWHAAGVAEQIDLQVAPALETLRALPEGESIDLAFIDADKPNYLNYYTELLPRVRRGGLILADNTLWSGRVCDPAAEDDANLTAIRQFNDAIAADDRVTNFILPVSDGLTVITKL